MIGRRRAVVKGALALSGLAVALPTFGRAAGGGFDPAPGAWRRFEVTTQIDLTGSGRTQAWIPLPSIDAGDWIKPLGDDWTISNGSAKAVRVGLYDTKLLHVEWADTSRNCSVRVVSRVATRDRRVDLAKPLDPQPLDPDEHRLFLRPTALIPTDGIVKDTATKIIAGARTDEDKARRLYEWVVENTVRDPQTLGCGMGDIASMLRSGHLGGKCADLNALFVGMSRASGIPARDLYGIRVAPSQFGYKSLGANSAVISKSQHCRAEVYLAGSGWVPVDAADVRKVVLEEPPGNLTLEDPEVQVVRKTLFGGWESNWIAYNHGHDIPLPGTKQPPLDFLMYPQAEAGGEMRDSLNADSFRYAITARELTG
jgi:transglutaminase-like putative cysteine protease